MERGLFEASKFYDSSHISSKIIGSKNLCYRPSQFLEPNCMLLQFILIFETDSESVISFFNKGKSSSPGLPFCFFVNFTIYVIGVDKPWVALMANIIRKVYPPISLRRYTCAKYPYSAFLL